MSHGCIIHDNKYYFHRAWGHPGQFFNLYQGCGFINKYYRDSSSLMGSASLLPDLRALTLSQCCPHLAPKGKAEPGQRVKTRGEVSAACWAQGRADSLEARAAEGQVVEGPVRSQTSQRRLHIPPESHPESRYRA